MGTEILVNGGVGETRVAVVESGMLQEVRIERQQDRGLVGHIFRGKVVRVLPGMQAAFVDIGLERASFIHVSDMVAGRPQADDKAPLIQSLVKEGDTLVVQVAKDPIGTKGARLTTQLSLSSRYLVYMPESEPHIGISIRIEDEQQREHLHQLMSDVQAHSGIEGAFIVRTAAEAAGEEELKADAVFLSRLWQTVKSRQSSVPVPGSVYADLPVYLAALRDLVRGPIDKILVDAAGIETAMREFANAFVPEVAGVLELYRGSRPLFDLYGLEEEISKALHPRVDLKSGGYLVIEQTESMTTVDVNTGGFVGHRNLEETIYKTNLEAAAAVARQLRLRNLGGIIIVDFIDMHEAEHQRQVLRVLEKALERDPAKTAMTGVTELGLVQVTRKRTRESLEQLLCQPCPVCEGRGSIKTAESICQEIFREIVREAQVFEQPSFLILASQSVVDRLLDEDAAQMAELERDLKRSFRFQVEPMYTQEQFDVVPV
ncbi:MAG: ribonuclease G [Gammaproteobacteria bacterium]|nr:MAG: ribonuclease G [Gammaproteobacteria bacterium]